MIKIDADNRPHVVILGAGASCAAIPNGDKRGIKISAMNGFIEKLGLADILGKVKINTTSTNLEDIYMELDERSKTEIACREVKEELEEKIRKYMNEYRLPDNPGIYDFLILSLTPKDLIATFNWDPLLVQALERCSTITTNLPQVCFLHGNVAVGICDEHPIMGRPCGICPYCNRDLKPMKLLYPVKDKNYSGDSVIYRQWKLLEENLQKAYMVTIFGYSAPKSDIKAIAMMKKAWGLVEERNLEEIEIVDIREEQEVLSSWKDFIYSHHYKYCNDFFMTTLAKFPRRSCETTFNCKMKNIWPEHKELLKPNMSFDELESSLQNLLYEEETDEYKQKHCLYRNASDYNV